jgi:hypothetical protein
VGRPEGKRQLGIPRRMGRIILIRDTGWGGMDWIDLAQDSDQWRAIVNTVTDPRVP